MKNQDTLRYIAGACFTAGALLIVIDVIGYALRLVNNSYWYSGLLDTILYVICHVHGLSLLLVVGYVLIAASMFASKPVLTTVGGVVGLVVALKDIWSWLGGGIRGYIDNFIFYSTHSTNSAGLPYPVQVSQVLCIAFWIIIAIIGLNKKKTKQLGFAAGIVAALRFLYIFIYNLAEPLYRWNFTLSYLWLPLTGFLSLLLLIIGAFTIGNASANMPIKAAAKPSASASGVNAVSSESQADRLAGIKKLLDSGVITQEEFEEKKKQILGS